MPGSYGGGGGDDDDYNNNDNNKNNNNNNIVKIMSIMTKADVYVLMVIPQRLHLAQPSLNTNPEPLTVFTGMGMQGNQPRPMMTMMGAPPPGMQPGMMGKA